MKRLATLAILVIVPSLLCFGCKRIESIPNQKQTNADAAPATTIPSGATVIDVDGEAISPRNSDPDDRVRAAAILDALRKFALESKDNAQSLTAQDTVISSYNWDGIEIQGVTIRRAGVVLLDSVVLNIVNFPDENLDFRRWKSFNMSLVEPGVDHDLDFEELIESLKAHGIEVKSSRPVGRGLWRESLSIRRWANQ